MAARRVMGVLVLLCAVATLAGCADDASTAAILAPATVTATAALTAAPAPSTAPPGCTTPIAVTAPPTVPVTGAAPVTPCPRDAGPTPTVVPATPTTAATPATPAGPSGASAVATGDPSASWVLSPTVRWPVRSVDTMKLSRDTLKTPLTDARIAADVRLDARLHLTHVTVDVYYDAPDYLARWVRAVRAVGLHVWFRAHWFAWENHRDARGHVTRADMTPPEYIAATRRFLQVHAGLLQNGDIFDFCSEPENGVYWLRTYGKGWSYRSPEAKHLFNVFIRSGVRLAATTLAHRGRGGVLVTAISVSHDVALHLLSKPTVRRLGLLTLDLYPERRTRDATAAARLLVAQIAAVQRKWRGVPVLLGEHGYARDMPVDDRTQARVLAAELAALARLPYLRGLNYWVDAGGPGYGGYTNLYGRDGAAWRPRPAASALAQAYASAS